MSENDSIRSMLDSIRDDLNEQFEELFGTSDGDELCGIIAYE